MSTKKRVVVTGLGIISPVGNNIEDAWQNILQGRSGVGLIKDFDTANFPVKFAGLVKDFNVEQYMTLQEARRCDEFIQYGVAAACQAIQDSGIKAEQNCSARRVGVLMGSGIGGIATIENNKQLLIDSGPRRVSPFFIPASIVNMTSGHISIMHGFKGPNLALATACTTGTHSIGMAMRMIQYGEVDVAIAGGSEKASTPLGMSGFSSLRALSTKNDTPEKASRPWDKDRDGFVLGDGAGCLVLEEYEHAKARGAKIYAEVVGFGMSADAFHITRPSGIGAKEAMENAIEDSKLPVSKIHYVNAHGTSTPAGDVEESKAIEAVFGDSAKNIAVSSTKSMTGHLLGAAGAVEAIFSILAIRDQIAPPTINLDNLDEGCNLNYVPHNAQKVTINAALSNSFGFGGTNGSLIFAKI